MKEEGYQWNIKVITENYQHLHLTAEQADKIFSYIRERDISSEKHFFSQWEEWDYEAYTFRQILTDEQYKIYEQRLLELISQYEKTLLEQDNPELSGFNYHQELFLYYKDVFIPGLYKDPHLIYFACLPGEKSKIDFLKSEYKTFLSDRKKQILIDHFRNYRLYKPKALKTSLERHRILYIWPDFHMFKYAADEAVKSIVSYLTPKLYLTPKAMELLKRKTAEAESFCLTLYNKHFKEQSLHKIIIERTEREKKENLLMSLLLMDRDNYYDLK